MVLLNHNILTSSSFRNSSKWLQTPLLQNEKYLSTFHNPAQNTAVLAVHLTAKWVWPSWVRPKVSFRFFFFCRLYSIRNDCVKCQTFPAICKSCKYVTTLNLCLPLMWISSRKSRLLLCESEAYWSFENALRPHKVDHCGHFAPHTYRSLYGDQKVEAEI